MLFFLILFIWIAPYSVEDLLLQFTYGRYDIMALIFLFDVMKAAIISGLLISLLIFFILLRVRKEYKSDGLIKYDFSYTINKEGVNQKISRSNMFIEWENVYKVHEKKRLQEYPEYRKYRDIRFEKTGLQCYLLKDILCFNK